MNPFKLALENGHKSVARVMLGSSKDAECVGPMKETIEWALDKNLTTFFEVWQLFCKHFHHGYCFYGEIGMSIAVTPFFCIHSCLARLSQVFWSLHLLMLVTIP